MLFFCCCCLFSCFYVLKTNHVYQYVELLLTIFQSIPEVFRLMFHLPRPHWFPFAETWSMLDTGHSEQFKLLFMCLFIMSKICHLCVVKQLHTVLCWCIQGNLDIRDLRFSSHVIRKSKKWKLWDLFCVFACFLHYTGCIGEFLKQYQLATILPHHDNFFWFYFWHINKGRWVTVMNYLLLLLSLIHTEKQKIKN